MPKINVLQERQRQRTRTGGNIASPGAARGAFAGQIAVARGLQNLGRGVVAASANIQAQGDRIEKEIERKEEMKRVTDERVRFINTRQRANELNNELEIRADEDSPDGLATVDLYTDASIELDTVAQEVEDPLLRAQMDAHVSGLRLRSQARLSSLSDRKSTLAFNDEVQGSVNAKAKLIQDNPFAAPRMLAESREDIGGLSELYGKDKQKAINAAHNFYANNAMGAFLRDGEKDERFLDDGIAILKGKGPKEMVEVANGLKPSQRAKFLEDFQRAKDRKKTTGISELRTNMSDVIAFTLNGGVPAENTVRDLRMEINRNTSMKTVDKVRAHDTLNSALVTGVAMKDAKQSPPSQWQGIIDSSISKLNAVNAETAELDPSLGAVTKKTFNAAQRLQHQQLLRAQMTQIQNQRLKDPVASVLTFEDIQEKATLAQSGDPKAVNNYLTAIKAKQDYLQIPERFQRTLAKEESFQLGAMVNSASNGDQLAAVMDGLEQKYAGNFSRVFQEITQDNKLDPALFISTQFQDFNTKARVLDNIANKKDINESAKTIPAFNQVQLDGILNQKMDGIRKSMASTEKTGFRAEVFIGFRDAIETESKRRLTISGNFADVDNVIDESIDFIIGSNYDQVEGGASLILMPKGKALKPNNKILVESFMSVYSESENFETLLKDGEPVTYHIPAAMVKRFGAKKARAEYMEALEDNSRWVANESMTGVVLVYDDPSIGEALPVADAQGKDIQFSFEEISYNADAKTLNEATELSLKISDFLSGETAIKRTGGKEIFPGGPIIAGGSFSGR